MLNWMKNFVAFRMWPARACADQETLERMSQGKAVRDGGGEGEGGGEGSKPGSEFGSGIGK